MRRLLLRIAVSACGRPPVHAVLCARADTRLEPVVLSQAERLTLENWAKRRLTAQGPAVRACIVPACANGRNNTEVAERLDVGRGTVRR
ncbi:hypothetical protein [Streptomyces sp. NPDC047974]|uniref:hypothetical protein n=1 Tax=Streptomyces sp. NPDC047974 TaxID=3154343 RepID=UPI0033D5C37E